MGADAEVAPAAGAAAKWWRRPWPYVLLGLLLGLLLGVGAILVSSYTPHDSGGFTLESLDAFEIDHNGFGEYRIVNLTAAEVSTLPGNLPEAFQKAHLIGRADVHTTIRQREAILATFHWGEDPVHPWTLVRYEGTVYSYFWAVA